MKNKLVGYWKGKQRWKYTKHPFKGRKHSEEAKRKMSEARRRWHKKNVFKHSEETKAKLSISRLGKNNPSWKGDEVGYTALHEWVRNHKLKPKLCEKCKKKPPYEVANISGRYKRDINDFEWLCRSCHMKSDGRMDILNIYSKQRKIR